MTDAARRRRVEDVCAAALERKAGARAAFVASACGDDEALRQEVDALLAHAQTAEAFLAAPIGAVAANILGDASGASLAGRQIGSYRMLSLLGAGGMGEVYQATDTRLGREVAIKILPRAFTNDPERLARFTREAQTLAALNHPNIAHIHGLEDAGGVRALVMELVEGEDLAQRIARGAIPLDEALPIARQIAEALEAAHEQGIIHRDLKPANIKVRPDGTVKVLDFGLAKLNAPNGPNGPNGPNDPNGPNALSMSPTITSPAMMTGVGVLLGTAAYMSPEQARGKPVDRRTDIWAFGVVVFEMLTGQPLFTGEDVSEILASVVKEPPSLDRLPAGTPIAIRRLIARCLIRDPLKRLRDIGEARVLLQELPPEDAAAPVVRGVRARAEAAAWIAAGLLAAAVVALAVVLVRRSPAPDSALRLSVALPENFSVASLALSPDGRRLAVAFASEGKRQLWLRALDSSQLQLLPDTLQAQYPFWSPDGRFIGFLGNGTLRVIPATGGPSQILCEGAGNGGTWNRNGVILFAAAAGPIRRVSATGGACTAVTKTDLGVLHRFPVFLPDGNHFFYVADGPDKASNGVYLAALDSPANARRLLADQSSVVFAPRSSGGTHDHILFLRDFTLMAQPFDATTLQLAGDVFPVASRASFSTTGIDRQVAASASDNGRLVYLGDRTTESQLAWLDRSGRELETVVRGEQRMVALSPDGKTVALGSLEGLWLRDLTRGVETRFTFSPRRGSAPVWSPDGARIAFGDANALYVKEANGAGPETRVLQTAHTEVPSDWSRDGSLLYTEVDPKTQADLWVLPGPLTSSAHPAPVKFLVTEFNESMGQFSPDGRWIAYVSDESGQDEVYIRPYPPGPEKVRVSRNRANEPRWRRDGKELFFMEGAARYTWTAVPIQTAQSGALQIGEPKPLFTFDTFTSGSANNLFVYSPAADGQGFLVNSQGNSGSGTLNVITNWERAATESGAK